MPAPENNPNAERVTALSAEIRTWTPDEANIAASALMSAGQDARNDAAKFAWIALRELHGPDRSHLCWEPVHTASNWAERDAILCAIVWHLLEPERRDALNVGLDAVRAHRAIATLYTNCDERIEPNDVNASKGICGSCNHNAARSGA